MGGGFGYSCFSIREDPRVQGYMASEQRVQWGRRPRLGDDRLLLILFDFCFVFLRFKSSQVGFSAVVLFACCLMFFSFCAGIAGRRGSQPARARGQERHQGDARGREESEAGGAQTAARGDPAGERGGQELKLCRVGW